MSQPEKVEHHEMGYQREQRGTTSQIQQTEREQYNGNQTQATLNNGNKRESKGKLKCMLINARSIINKKEEIEAKAYEENPDFIFVTKSWDTCSQPIPQYNR